MQVRCLENLKVFVATGMSTMCVGMGSSIFLPAPHLIWGIDYQIRGKQVLLFLKKVNGEGRKFLFLYPISEKAFGPMSSKVDVMKFL